MKETDSPIHKAMQQASTGQFSAMFDKIARHIGHNIEVASYGNHNYKPADNGVENLPAEEIVNVAVECMDCYEVIVDADNEELE